MNGNSDHSENTLHSRKKPGFRREQRGAFRAQENCAGDCRPIAPDLPGFTDVSGFVREKLLIIRPFFKFFLIFRQE
jgi:hypothetical protein